MRHSRTEAVKLLIRRAKRLVLPRNAQMRRNTRKILCAYKRLGNIITAACIKSGGNNLGCGLCGDEDHRNFACLPVFLDAAAQLESVHALHVDIEHDQIRQTLFEECERRPSACGGVYAVALLPQDRARKRQMVGQVVHDEDMRCAFRQLLPAHAVIRR